MPGSALPAPTGKKTRSNFKGAARQCLPNRAQACKILSDNVPAALLAAPPSGIALAYWQNQVHHGASTQHTQLLGGTRLFKETLHLQNKEPPLDRDAVPEHWTMRGHHLHFA